MRKGKDHVQLHDSNEFKNLQAQPLPHKIAEIKNMLQRNNELVIINNSLYKCICIIAAELKKNGQDNTELAKTLKQIIMTGNSNKAKTNELTTRIEESVHREQSLLPSFNKLRRHNSSAASATTAQSSATTAQSRPREQKILNESEAMRLMPEKEAHELIKQLKLLIDKQNGERQELKQTLSSKSAEYDTKITQLEAQIKQNNRDFIKLKDKVTSVKSIRVVTLSEFEQFKKDIIKIMTVNKFQIDKQITQFQQKLHTIINNSHKQLTIATENTFYDELVVNVSNIINIEIKYDENKLMSLVMQIKRKLELSVDNARQQTVLSIMKQIQRIETVKNTTLNQSQAASSLNLTRQFAIVKKYKEALDQNIKLRSIIQSKQKDKDKDKKLSNQQILLSNPLLSFINSRILPILSEQDSKKIHEKQMFILQAIENYYKKNKKILQFKQLFGFQQFREAKINFHFLVDDCPHLLLIVLLKNETIIGAFSEAGLCQTQAPNRNKGFLFQVESKKIFTSRLKYENNAIFPYQQYYISVGNLDMNIKMDSTLVQSCFGSETSLFRPNSQYKINDLLNSGEGVSQTQLIDYEFYEVQFHSNQ